MCVGPIINLYETTKTIFFENMGNRLALGYGRHADVCRMILLGFLLHVYLKELVPVMQPTLLML